MFKSTMSFIGFTPQFRHSLIPMAALGIVAQENGYGQTKFVAFFAFKSAPMNGVFQGLT